MCGVTMGPGLLEVHFHLDGGAYANLRSDVQFVNVFLHVWQTHAGTETHVAYLGAGGG